jgi:putative ABC transport system permease protein
MNDFFIFWDKARRSLVLALRSLWLHKLRAVLSVLGIIIGTAAVISLMSFGKGSMHDALEDIKRQGATNIIVRSVKPPDEGNSQRRTFVASYGLTYDDFDSVSDISTVIRAVPMRVFSQEVRRYDLVLNGRLVGTTADYATVNQQTLAAGRFLTDDGTASGGGDQAVRGRSSDQRNVGVGRGDAVQACSRHGIPFREERSAARCSTTKLT